METARLIILGMAGALLLSTVVQAEEADSTVTSGKLLDQSRLRASGYGSGLTTDDTADQRNRVWSMQGAQDGSYNGTAVQTRQQTRTQEQQRLQNREHSYQGDGSGSRYGQGYESRGGNGGYGTGSGGSGRSGRQGGGRR